MGHSPLQTKVRPPSQARRFFLVHDVPEGHSQRIACSPHLRTIPAQCARYQRGSRRRHASLCCQASRSKCRIYVPPFTWSVQYGQTAEARLLVTCSQSYERADYISDYLEFRRLALLSAIPDENVSISVYGTRSAANNSHIRWMRCRASEQHFSINKALAPRQFFRTSNLNP